MILKQKTNLNSFFRQLISVFIITGLLVISGCGGAKKSIQKGDYEKAITKSINKLKKKPNDAEALQVLDMAFNKIAEQDLFKVKALKQEGRPDNWDAIYKVYKRLDDRQQKIKKLMTIPSGISFTDYTQEIINAKEKAAAYYYAHAMQLLDKNDRMAARQAYDELINVKYFYPNFRDIDDKIVEAKNLGTTYVHFEFVNNTNQIVPKIYERELNRISLTGLNSTWINYHSNKQGNVFYDYTIRVNLKRIIISPERDKEIQYTETKKIRDGWKYELDEKGNVKKDTAGNDIKIPKFITISCKVVEKYQSKKAMVTGLLEYFDNRTKQMIKQDPITAESFWEHRSGLAMGDVRALKPATKKIIGIPPAHFPPNMAMLEDATQTLKKMVKDILYRNKRVLK